MMLAVVSTRNFSTVHERAELLFPCKDLKQAKIPNVSLAMATVRSVAVLKMSSRFHKYLQVSQACSSAAEGVQE